MIARLIGRLAEKSPEALVVDVGGVGYLVHVSLTTFCALPEVGAQVDLAIQTQVRENAIELFGFGDRQEKALFVQLTTVSGIGPRMAIGILSGMPAPELAAALAEGDVRRLMSIPGLGRKRAERLIVELQDRVRPLAGPSATPAAVRPALADEAVSALVNLGYRAAEAERAVTESLRGGVTQLPDLIRVALRELSAGGAR